MPYPSILATLGVVIAKHDTVPTPYVEFARDALPRTSRFARFEFLNFPPNSARRFGPDGNVDMAFEGRAVVWM